MPGARIFPTPEEARANEVCRVLLATPAGQAAPVPINSYHEQVYHAFNQSYSGAVFWAKLASASGCVPELRKVVSYSANFIGAIAAVTVKMPCTGNGCDDVVYEDAKCELRNIGSKTVAIKVVAKELGVTITMPALAPGLAIPLRGFSGCLKPQGVASSEVNYK